jgi:hypothetical protein
MWLGVVVYDWNLDEKSLSTWWESQLCKFMIPGKIYKERQIMSSLQSVLVRLAVYDEYWAREKVLVTLNAIFSVVSGHVTNLQTDSNEL